MHTYTKDQLHLLIVESNLIEDITREPQPSEVEAAERLLSLDRMTTPELCRYQWAIAPGYPLRIAEGMDVEVGRPERAVRSEDRQGDKVQRQGDKVQRQGDRVDNVYVAPPGGANIRARLDILIDRANTSADPWDVHIRFEVLHPFMGGPEGGNGRAGRMLWLWMMRDQHLVRSFLHQFYYQTLQNSR